MPTPGPPGPPRARKANPSPATPHTSVAVRTRHAVVSATLTQKVCRGGACTAHHSSSKSPRPPWVQTTGLRAGSPASWGVRTNGLQTQTRPVPQSPFSEGTKPGSAGSRAAAGAGASRPWGSTCPPAALRAGGPAEPRGGPGGREAPEAPFRRLAGQHRHPRPWRRFLRQALATPWQPRGVCTGLFLLSHF